MKIFEVFEDSLYYYIVTELLTGGEIYQKIVEEAKLSENLTSTLIKQAFQALNYCHQKHIIHR